MPLTAMGRKDYWASLWIAVAPVVRAIITRPAGV